MNDNLIPFLSSFPVALNCWVLETDYDFFTKCNMIWISCINLLKINKAINYKDLTHQFTDVSRPRLLSLLIILYQPFNP